MIKKISNESWQILSAIEDIYEDLVKTKKLFSDRYHLFAAGLVYGLLHNKHHDTKPHSEFIKLLVITDDDIKNVIDVVFSILDDGREPREIWNEMLHIADGGVLELNKIYASNKDFRISHIFEEAEKLWPDRAKNLYNINLD